MPNFKQLINDQAEQEASLQETRQDLRNLFFISYYIEAKKLTDRAIDWASYGDTTMHGDDPVANLVFVMNERDVPMTENDLTRCFHEFGYPFKHEHVLACRPDSREEIARWLEENLEA